MTTRILFVCMGNICRSPTAEGVFRYLIEQKSAGPVVEFDSAGTHGYHIGRPADERAVAAAARRGISLAGIRARQVEIEDFERFDLILAADESNLADLERLRPRASRARLRLLLDYAEGDIREVPDPYYGGDKGFEQVLDLVEAACEGLIRSLSQSREGQ
ncbi:low molecular weight protein-tyrosine-phosphatase [Natronospira bacteriovora]|uniref:protein-tyrosine-phosphatase n=1 Tax=Natronospira bacteriovora TaxID=3069753 RepID=A0ABU0W2K8_9GAMM|nr:low molecular weight protein-tyrosine-phosphatase [Natronospira sp. AB-CW4]MDQ2068253.1 low molecular weight protein-tyrosine-phosphatase [Natronospira sp. AB-CW4]